MLTPPKVRRCEDPTPRKGIRSREVWVPARKCAVAGDNLRYIRLELTAAKEILEGLAQQN